MKITGLLITMCLLLFAAQAVAQDLGGNGTNGAGDGGGKLREKMRKMAEGVEGQRMIGQGRIIEKILADPALIEKIGLSEDQITKLKTAFAEWKTQRDKLSAERDAGAKQQADAVSSEKVDEEGVMKIVEKMGEINTKLAKIEVAQLLFVKKLLTPDQITKMREVGRELVRNDMEQMREKMKEKNKQERKDRRNGGDEPPPPADTKPTE
jgi:hypothetical protein